MPGLLVKKPWVTTHDGKRKLRTHGGMVHLVHMKRSAIAPDVYTERGYTHCGMYVRAAHGAWVDIEEPLTCMACMVIDEPVTPKNRWKQR